MISMESVILREGTGRGRVSSRRPPIRGASSVALLAAALTFTSGCAIATESEGDHTAPDAKLLDSSDGSDWAAYGRTYGEGHYSPLTEITGQNVQRLGLQWSLDLPVGNSVTTPLAVDGILYFATGYSVVHAVDARTGSSLWTYDPLVALQAGHKLQAPWGTRGLAWWRDRVFTATADGRLIAIDRRNGQPFWSVLTVGKDDGRYITGAPRVFDGKVVIGHGGADFSGVRGYVTAYDVESGKQLWRFYTVPGNPADGADNAASDSIMPTAAKTWSGEWWRYGGGGTVWNAITYDQEFNTILLGTGNGAPWNHRIRSEGKGDNLFLCSMIAVDARTGQYKWHYQFNPGETWDYNAAMDMQIAELRIDGATRKVVVTAPKNGFFYVIDRTNGKLISAEPFAVVNWATKIDVSSGRPVEVPEARYPNGATFLLRPSPSGAHNWNPMSFNPGTGLVYIPTLNFATKYNDRGITAKTWTRRPGVVLNGGINFEYVFDDSIPELNTASLLAWDPVRQQEVWRVKQPDFWNGGVLSTAGNLVFQGETNGRFSAYDAVRGERLWSFEAQAPVLAAPISYRVDGRQYVTVLSGYGATPAAFGPLLAKYDIDYRTQRRRVLTFALDGPARLPPPQVRMKPERPPDQTFAPDDAAAQRGMVTFGTRCALCHGFNMVAGGNAPDLRDSAAPLDAQAFASIARDGALLPLGMPRFDDMTEAEREDLRQYIRTRRRE
jgi:quinohemoprotein ethanol dehydrogenase